VHPTCGILRDLGAFFWLRAFSTSQTLSTLRPHAGNANRWALNTNIVLQYLLMKNSIHITVSEQKWTRLIYIIPFTAIALLNLYLVYKGSIEALGVFLSFVGPLLIWSWYHAIYTIQLTEESVTVNTLFGRFRITWDEIERIFIKGSRIALLGRNKRVILSPDPTLKSVGMMTEFINQKIEQKNIKVEEVSIFPRLHKNSRVWR
jgi:hypothetical protein